MSFDDPPRKLVRHFNEPGDLHELTFSCFHRKQLLISDAWRSQLARSIDRAGELQRFELIAFVFMPEHVHLLVRPLQAKPDIDKYLWAIKQPFSRKIKSLLVQEKAPLLQELTIRERPGKLTFRFWQEGPGCDRNLYTEKAILGSIDYLHRNPVERTLCVRAIDWKWSSASRYILPDEPPDPDLPKIFKLPGYYVQ